MLQIIQNKIAETDFQVERGRTEAANDEFSSYT